MKILVVDPDAVYAQTLVELLRLKGYEADHQGDLYGALADLKRTFRPLVIQETHLGKDSGLTLLKSLKNRTPVSWAIAMTHKPDSVTADLFVKHGANDFLYKPFAFETLEGLVRSYRDRWARWQADRINQDA